MDDAQIPFSLSASEIAVLIDQVAASDVTSVRLKTDEFELSISRGPQGAIVSTVPAEPASPESADPAPSPETPAAPALAPATPAAPEPAVAPPAVGSVTVSAPVVGMFYRRASPDEAPFVEVGSRVEPSTTVALVETMKVFTSVTAGVAGVVVSIDVEDQDAVEAGQALMQIAPEPR